MFRSVLRRLAEPDFQNVYIEEEEVMRKVVLIVVVLLLVVAVVPVAFANGNGTTVESFGLTH